MQQRRYEELRRRGMQVKLADVVASLAKRDKRDQIRDADPLRQAADSVVLDTSEIPLREAVARAARVIDKALLDCGWES